MYFRAWPRVLALSTAAFMCSAGAAPAAVLLFSDNFNDGSITGGSPGGWTTFGYTTTINYGSPHNYVAAMKGGYNAATDSPDAWIQRTFSGLADYKDFYIRFDWIGHDAELGDRLKVAWKPTSSSTWDVLTPTGYNLDLDTWQSVTSLYLPDAADNLDSIDIRFFIEVSNKSDWGKIDNFKLKGTYGPQEVPPPEVPIPGALPLFASAVALYGGLVYRRRRNGMK